MDLTINCKVSLSKKLRNILGKGGTLVLTTSELQDGRGIGNLSLSSEDLQERQFNMEDILVGETSIQISQIDVVNEVPNSDTKAHASIFSTMPEKGKEEGIVKKIAAVNAPEKEEVPRAIKEEVVTPDAFSELDENECKEWIDNLEGLIEAVTISRQKQSSVNLEGTKNNREYKEQKEKEEAIDIPAWIVNDKVGALSINDLDISLLLNSPLDLGNISARRIAASKDLKNLLKSGYVKFISPRERKAYISKISETENALGLDVFDNPKLAEANMSNAMDIKIDEENHMDVVEDIDNLTNEESMIFNLTQDMPTIKSTSTIPQSTIHSNRSQPTSPNNSNIKTIRKAD